MRMFGIETLDIKTKENSNLDRARLVQSPDCAKLLQEEMVVPKTDVNPEQAPTIDLVLHQT